MFLKKEKKGEKPKFMEEEEIVSVFVNVGVANGIRKSCKTCGKIYGSVCYIEYPEMVSEWYHEMIRGTKRKRIENEVIAAIAFSF